MKLLITNPDAIYNTKTNEYYDGILDVLNEFNERDDRGIVVISAQYNKLNIIPKEFNPLHVNGKQRRGKQLINLIESKLKIKVPSVIVLGTKIDDVMLASNSKILLLRADYTQHLDPDNRLFTKSYGVLGIRDSNHLHLVLSKFRDVVSPWYFKLKVSDITTIYSLTNANTMGYRGTDAVILSNEFKDLLKKGDLSNFDEFALFFMISTYKLFDEFKDIDYWCVYPTSDGSIDVDLHEFAKKMRESLNKTSPGDLLRRSKPVDKRRSKPNTSIFDTISTQINSIDVNLRDFDLKGKSVCVIDDFSTYGTSCETVRYLLEKEGVKKIIFITMGKFGKDYHKLVRDKATGKIIAKNILGDFNSGADIDFVKSLKELI